MKRIVLPTIFRQIRKYHTENIVPPGQRLTYLPPKTKPTQKSKDVTAIYFGSGRETQDDLRSEIFQNLKFNLKWFSDDRSFGHKLTVDQVAQYFLCDIF